MSTPTSIIMASSVIRPIAKFHPCIWGDHFINYTPIKEEVASKRKQEHESLKSQVRKELLQTIGKPLDHLKMIDSIERLGIAYHFKKEIEASLRQIYENHDDNLDLYHASLQFRILRQHGYYISPDAFLKFMDEDGSFLEEDVAGLLSLYEASCLRGTEERTLEKAKEFSKARLQVIASRRSHPLASQIARALACPIHMRVDRIETRNYLSCYEQDLCHNESLLRLAKLDFDLLQSLYKEELQELVKWWRSFDFPKTLPFIRDRVVEAYLFSVGVYYEPKFSVARAMYTKAFMMLTICDDIYDSYGTLEELEAFTEAICRWEKGSADELPDYMKLFYEIQYNTYKQFEDDLAKLRRRNDVRYAVQELKNASRWYLKEARWREAKYIPTFDEYFENAVKSIACATMVIVSFLDNELEETTTKKAFESVSRYCKPQRATCIIGRLNNDLGDHKWDKHRDHVAGAVDCYMKQHSVSEEKAYAALNIVIEDAWKDINEEIFHPVASIPRPLLMRIYNFCRMVEYVYRNEDGFTIVSQRVKDAIKLVFIEPLVV